MASKVVSRFIKLNSGFDCPILGYGTYLSKDNEQLKNGLKAAIQVGYRHIDTARIYDNEAVIGETLDELFKAGVVKREEIFLTTKLHQAFYKRSLVVDALKKQLELLKTSYVDLYLIHFPVACQMSEPNTLAFDQATGKVLVDPSVRIEETWAGMEDCVKAGLARSIGVSNFNISQIERLMKSGTIKPAMNQIENHPGFQNKKNTEFCQSHGVAVTAHSQFGNPGTLMPISGKPQVDMDIFGNETLKKLAAKHGKTVPQIIVRWQIQRNVVVIPKSLTPSRIAENFNIWDFELSQDDMKEIAAVDTDKRFIFIDYPGMTDHPDYPHILGGGSC